MGKQTRYLIRARFLYGNYDKEGLLPSFALYIGVDLWDTVSITDVDIIETKEIIHAPSLDYVDVCLVETGLGVPFISVLELRPLLNETYATEPGSGLQLFRRLNFNSNDSDYMRYHFFFFCLHSILFYFFSSHKNKISTSYYLSLHLLILNIC